MNTYQVGDLFTTQKSKVTGVIKAIEPKSANKTLLLLDVDGEERFTTVTIQQMAKQPEQVVKLLIILKKGKLNDDDKKRLCINSRNSKFIR